MFYPRAFAVSPSLSTLNTPWFMDYGHLTFWFFFFATFVLVMWLTTLHGLMARNIEARAPRRETRGFSRAQAGDVMTAILPMTWSITMLLHATTHSTNFDENTAATAFSFTVVAYQWGWNYYFPRDIVEKLARSPRLVGHGNVDQNGSYTDYSFLLERARSEYLARLTSRGLFADRQGKDSAANLLTFFVRSGGAGRAYIESEFLDLLACGVSHRMAPRAALTKDAITVLGPSGAYLMAQEGPWSLASWQSANLGARRLGVASGPLASTSLPQKFMSLTPKTNPGYFQKPLPRAAYARPLRPFWLEAASLCLLSKEQAPNTTRAPHTFGLVGNRLALIHRHLASAASLPAYYSERPLQAAYLRRLGAINLASPYGAARVPSWLAYSTLATFPLKANNISPNLWLCRSSAYSPTGARPWYLATGAALLRPASRPGFPFQPQPYKAATLAQGTLPAGSLMTPQLSLLSRPSSLAVDSTGAFNFAAYAQRTLYSGAAYMAGASAPKIATFDDFGLSSAASVKEVSLRASAVSARAAALSLAPLAGLGKASTGFPGGCLYHPFDVGARLLGAHTSATPYAKALRGPALVPSGSSLSFHWPLATASFALGAPSAACGQWRLAALPLPRTTQEYLSLADRLRSLPLATLSTAAKLRSGLTSLAWMAPLAPARTSGATSLNLRQRGLLLAPSGTVVVQATRAGLQNQGAKRPSLSTSPLCALQPTIIISPCEGPLVASSPLSLKGNPQQPWFVAGPAFVCGPTLPWTGVSRLGPLFAGSKLSGKPAIAPLLPAPAPARPLTELRDYFLPRPSQGTQAPLSPLWLEGPAPGRPVRTGSDKTKDPINFTGKADLLQRQPFFTNPLLFSWGWHWSGSVSAYGAPLAKLGRGATARRHAGGFWNLGWANDNISAAALLPDKALRLDKAPWQTQVALTRRAVRQPSYHTLAPALLDNEWVALAKTPLHLTPEPYEDVDPAFVHQKWSLEVNTTRRSDHNSKHKVTWGPFAAAKLRRLSTRQARAAASQVGPSGAVALPTRISQTLALYDQATLPFKGTPGLLPLTVRSRMGAFFVARSGGAALYKPADAASSHLTSPAKLVSGLRLGLTQRGQLSSTPKATRSAWLRLWTFKAAAADQQTLGATTHTTAYPSYWVVRALLTLSVREELLAASQSAGSSRAVLGGESAVGAQNKLLRDVMSVFALAPHEAKKRSLSAQSWHQATRGAVPAYLEGALQSALERTTETHLLARAGHSLIQEEIGSIRRLRVTKGVYLPSDVPMHAICGSKDVIHSWALPGLNIKIDCIPGFNSHRRVLLRWRGAYWGQCMEVCGRYHHWMPILVHVVHKDIFLSWCLSYLRLIEARLVATDNAAALAASLDAAALNLLFEAALGVSCLRPGTSVFKAHFSVSADLLD